MYVYKVVF